MKKFGLVILMLLAVCTTAFAADVTWELDDTITVSGTALENEQYELVVVENGEERSVILDGVTGIIRVISNPSTMAYCTDILRITRDVTLQGVDYSYSTDFDDRTVELIGQLDLETMTVVAEPIYFFDHYETYHDFDYCIGAVDVTEFSYYKGQQSALDGKFGVVDRDFNVVVPFAYDSIKWLGWAFLETTKDGQKDVISPTSGNSFSNVTASYVDFETFDRYVVKQGGISYLVDGELNVVAGEYTHVLELDYGKWLVSTDPSQTAPVYDTVIDNDGNVLPDYDWQCDGVVSDWATPYVDSSKSLGLICSKEAPFSFMEYALYQEEITRMAFCRLIQNFLVQTEIDVTYEDVPFTDIDTNNLAIEACYHLGIVNGKSDTEFDPYASITRQEAATMLLRLCDVLDLDTSARTPESQFSDFNQVDSWAKDGVLAISALKNTNGEAIMGGTSEATFDPLGTYTLEQAITTLVRLSDVLPDLPEVYSFIEEILADGSRRVFFTNEKGEIVSDKYDNGRDFQNGFAAVEIDGKWGFLDNNFELVVPAEYGFIEYHDTSTGYSAWGFDENGIVMLEKDYKWGYVDSTGTELTEFIYTDVRQFSDGLARVSLDDTSRMAAKNPSFGYIDMTGEMVIEPGFAGYVPGDFVDGYAPLGDGLYIDKTGALVDADN